MIARLALTAWRDVTQSSVTSKSAARTMWGDAIGSGGGYRMLMTVHVASSVSSDVILG